MLETKSFSVTIRRPKYPPTTLVCGSGANELRGTCQIEEGGQDYKNNATVKIYGVSLDKLKDFSSLALHQGKKVQMPETVIISVENKIIFSGDSFLTYADFSDFPDVCLKISAAFGFSAALVKHSPTYYKAEQKIKFVDAAAGLVAVLNKDLGLSDQKSKIALKTTPEARNLIVPDIVLSGTAVSKLHSLAYSLNLHRMIDHSGAYFWVPGKSYPAEFKRKKPEISKETGLVGYPAFYNEGINFTTTNVTTWKVGDYISVKSEVPFASGKYFILHQKIDLSTLPGGKWESEYNAVYAL